MIKDNAYYHNYSGEYVCDIPSRDALEKSLESVTIAYDPTDCDMARLKARQWYLLRSSSIIVSIGNDAYGLELHDFRRSVIDRGAYDITDIIYQYADDGDTEACISGIISCVVSTLDDEGDDDSYGLAQDMIISEREAAGNYDDDVPAEEIKAKIAEMKKSQKKGTE